MNACPSRLFAATIATTLVCSSLHGATTAPWTNEPLTVHAVWNFSTSPDSNGIVLPDVDTYSTVGDGGLHQLDGMEPYAFFPVSDFEWIYNQALNVGKMHNKSDRYALAIFYLPNWVDNYPVKDLRILFKYSANNPNNPSNPGEPITVGDIWPGDNSLAGRGHQTGEFQIDGQNRYEDWEMKPNPPTEKIFVNFPPNAYLDKITIDTICIPESSTFGFLTAGLLIFCRRSRARHSH